MCMSLSSCCCCVSLDLGAKMISIISTVASALTALVYGSVALLPSPARETRRIVFAGVASLSVCQLFIGCLLIYGIFGRKPRWMIPWVATSWAISVAMLLLSVLGAALVIMRAVDPGSEAEVTTMASMYFVRAVLLYYFASVVDSRREELVSDDNTDSAQRLMRQNERGFPKDLPV